uniref:HDC14581 n=1 Tax=Drosophila melanogaster TaxID=7227 RepID=Q6IJN3_DROME|nr:TPA_inf: HDC14581 [Drosophila melanogaster]
MVGASSADGPGWSVMVWTRNGNMQIFLVSACICKSWSIGAVGLLGKSGPHQLNDSSNGAIVDCFH